MLEIEADWQQKKKSKNTHNLADESNFLHDVTSKLSSSMPGGIMSKISNMINNDLKGTDINLDYNSNSTNDELSKIIQKNQLKSLIETDSKFKNKSDKNDKINLNMNSMNKTGQSDFSINDSFKDIDDKSRSHLDINIKDEILNEADLD